jgi:uncharacterized membrane protein
LRQIEAHEDHETAMIETHPAGQVVAHAQATAAPRTKRKLTAKQRETVELQKRVERMLQHTDKAVARKDEEARVRHAKQLLQQEVSSQGVGCRVSGFVWGMPSS